MVNDERDLVTTGALTLGQLYAKLTKILTDDPTTGSVFILLEGCDCCGLLGSAEIVAPYRYDEEVGKRIVQLERTDRTKGGW